MFETALLTKPSAIRRAGVADIAHLRAIAEKTWRRCYAAILSREQIDYMLEKMYAADVIERELSRGVIWELAFGEDKKQSGGDSSQRGKAIAFHSCEFDPVERDLKLHKLYVLPEAQRMGIGRMLLARIRALAVRFQAKKIWLQVNKRNAGAIRTYKSAGYRVERAAVFEIGGGFVMDDYIMAAELDGGCSLSPKDAAGQET